MTTLAQTAQRSVVIKLELVGDKECSGKNDSLKHLFLVERNTIPCS